MGLHTDMVNLNYINSHLISSRIFAALNTVTSGVLFFEVVCGTVFLATVIYQLELVRYRHGERNAHCYHTLSFSVSSGNGNIRSEFGDDGSWDVLGSRIDFAILLLCLTHIILG